MFGDVVDPSIKVGSQAWYTVPVSILAHIVLFAAVIIIPLMAADVLPTPDTMMAFRGASAAAATTSAPTTGSGSPKVTPTPVTNPNAAPTEAPKEIVPEAPAPATGVSEGVPGGVEGGIPGGTIGGVVGGLPAPPPPPPPPSAPVRVGGNIKAPTKTRNVNPIYPPIAQSARVQGVVIIEATIGPDGRVKDAKVLRSIPLLDQAALDAVKQWQFTPTLLNGVPVPVIMTVTVNFTLQ
jgi:protein TonB